MNNQPSDLPELQYLDSASVLLDSRFRIPGTDIRFGFDFLIGLVPFVGDLVTFGFSGLMVVAMARHGASGMVVVKMLWNILLDATVGSVPVVGDLFDLQYKANRRNYRLLAEHYREGAHRGSAWPVIIGILVVLLGMFFLLLWVLFWAANAVVEGVQAMF